uniref:FDXHR family putative zinc-binding protein n=1 Tax=Arthrobacter silvisoli TaxID=2291022 RepID=UPI003F495033
MSQPWHPRCGKRFSGAASVGHCAVCCETFVGVGTYDAHLSRDEAGKYIHLDPATTDPELKWWSDERGYWHKGPRLTAEQKAELFGTN